LGFVRFVGHIEVGRIRTVADSWGFEPRHPEHALRLLERWKEQFQHQVTHRFAFKQANEALRGVRELRSGKAVIVPQ
jgi:hypothetical protein